MRLLVVDDDVELSDLLVRALQRDGHEVSAVATIALARAALRGSRIDLVVLDLALPDGTGLELCEQLRRARSGVPILMLTAHSEVGRRVRALDAGADDFLGKPFAVAELRARVRALGRRSGAAEGLAAPSTLSRDDVELDVSTHRALRAGKLITLTAREWTIVTVLATQPRRLVTRQVLLAEVWGETSRASAASLEVLVGRIRRKLGEGLIRTVYGEGYVLEVT